MSHPSSEPAGRTPDGSAGQAAQPQPLDPAALTDSAGVPWKGRAFQENPHAGDDGSASPELALALAEFIGGAGSQIAVVDALRTARLLIPLLAERGDEGVGHNGLLVDKTQELSIVTVAAPDGRRVLPLFSDVAAMARWDAAARPVPSDGIRAALAAAADNTDLLVIDPGSDTEFVVRRPAVWAIAQGEPWAPSWQSPDVRQAFLESIATELAVIDVQLAAGDPQARLRGPELVVSLELLAGLSATELDAVLARLAGRWAADDRIAVLVDSLTIKLVRSV